MKKIILIIFALLALSTATSSSRIFAETLSTEQYIPSAKIDLAEVGKKIVNDVDPLGIRMGEPSFDDKVYNKKDVVNVTLPLTNKSDADYSDISISAYIMVHHKGSSTQDYGYQNNLAQVFLSKKASKEVKINFKMPDSINFKKDDSLRVEFIALTKSGTIIGLTGKNIKLGNFLEAVSINSAYITAQDKEYSLQQGPTVKKDTSPKLILEVKNTNSTDIVLFPKLIVYDVVPSKPEVGSKAYDSFTVKAGENKKITLDLPAFSKAAVYDGQMSFLDKEGYDRAPFISSRWIVEGDMATIPGVNINKSSFKEGEVAIIDVRYTGSPVNIETGESADIGTGTMKVLLLNEKKEIISEGVKDVDLNTMSGVATFESIALKDASSVNVDALITKGDVELVRYSTTLTDPDSNKKADFIKYIIAGLLALIIILIIFFLKKKYRPVSVAVLALIFVFSSMWGSDVLAMTGAKGYTRPHADYAPPTCSGGGCYSRTMNLYNSLGKTTFAPGEEMGYSIHTMAMAEVCLNNFFNTNVDYNVYNASDGSLVSSQSAYNILYPSGGHTTTYRSLPGFSPMTANTKSTSVLAPLTPGNYILQTNSNISWWRGGGNVTYGSNYTCTVARTPVRSGGWLTGSGGGCPPPGHELPSPLVNYFSFTVVAQTTTPNVVASVPWISNTQARIKWVYTDPKPQTGNVVEISKSETFDSVIQSISNTPPAVAKSNNFYHASVSMIKSLFGLEVVKAEANVDDTRSIIVSGLEPETKYYSRIKATNGDNWSAWSYKDFTTTVSSVPPDCDPLTDPSCPSTTTNGGAFEATCLVSSSTIKQGGSTTFTVAPLNSSGTVTYQWKEFNGPNISGQTATSYTRTYGDTGTFSLQVVATQVSATGITTAVTKDCSVKVNSMCGTEPSDDDKCIGGFKNNVSCDMNVADPKWIMVPTVEVCEVLPKVSLFKFDPNNTVVGSKCKLFLTATNVSSCYLKNKTGQKSVTETQIPAIGGNISVDGGDRVGASVGKHTLWCKGLNSTAAEKQYDKEKTCFSDSTFSED